VVGDENACQCIVKRSDGRRKTIELSSLLFGKGICDTYSEISSNSIFCPNPCFAASANSFPAASIGPRDSCQLN
jgi:hypothetical protein